MLKVKLFFQKLYLKLFKRGVYYINGPISLPEPLTKEDHSQKHVGLLQMWKQP